MKKLLFLLFIALLIISYANRLDFIENINLNNPNDLSIIAMKIKSDIMLLPMMNSRINLKTPNERLYKYLIILSQNKFKGTYYPVIAILEHKIPANIESAALSYLVNVNPKGAIKYIKNYILKQKKLKPIHYFVMTGIFSNFASFSTIVDKILEDPFNKAEASILLIANYKPDIKKYIVSHLNDKKFSKEKIYYILYYMASHLNKRDIAIILKDAKKYPKNCVMPISILSKTNYGGIKQLKKLTKIKNKNIRTIAQTKYDELLNTLSVKWVKDKIQVYDLKHEEFAKIYKDRIQVIDHRSEEFAKIYKETVEQSTFDFKTLVNYASIYDIESLKKLETVLAEDISNNTLEEIEL